MSMFFLLWLVTAVTGQLLLSPDGGCEEGWEWIIERNCKLNLDGKDQLAYLRKAEKGPTETCPAGLGTAKCET